VGSRGGSREHDKYRDFIKKGGALIACVVLRVLASEKMFCLMELLMVSDDQRISPEKGTVKTTKKLDLNNLQNSTSRSQATCSANTLGCGD
jgi:hypothetical protein